MFSCKWVWKSALFINSWTFCFSWISVSFKEEYSPCNSGFTSCRTFFDSSKVSKILSSSSLFEYKISASCIKQESDSRFSFKKFLTILEVRMDFAILINSFSLKYSQVFFNLLKFSMLSIGISLSKSNSAFASAVYLICSLIISKS